MIAQGGKSIYGASVGILMLDAQFPRIPGDMGNARTWPFPVLYRIVRNASPDLVVRQGAEGMLGAFIDAARAAADRVPIPEREPNAQIAYFSPEFGVSETLPQYSGGLGILAGDHLKAASDLDLLVHFTGMDAQRELFNEWLGGWFSLRLFSS